MVTTARPWTNAADNEEEPSMDLFKSIFASDEELDASDVEESVPEPEQPSSSPHPETRQEVQSLVLDSEPRDMEDNLCDLPGESVPADEPEPSVDSSVHQIFKHLFNPRLDSGPLESTVIKGS
ncbi:unnamed protein product [Dibothriocephalus latus]|uniref:Uncharacterized protein n=1 Tax=Dibothriocephalus latus TaxID=60516 RepID=A0A3P7P8V8_DIBLA|nr:unnamed protein product [Dibothriocephalus latus]